MSWGSSGSLILFPKLSVGKLKPFWALSLAQAIVQAEIQWQATCNTIFANFSLRRLHYIKPFWWPLKRFLPGNLLQLVQHPQVLLEYFHALSVLQILRALPQVIFVLLLRVTQFCQIISRPVMRLDLFFLILRCAHGVSWWHLRAFFSLTDLIAVFKRSFFISNLATSIRLVDHSIFPHLTEDRVNIIICILIIGHVFKKLLVKSLDLSLLFKWLLRPHYSVQRRVLEYPLFL